MRTIIRCIDCDRVLQDTEGAWTVDYRECRETDAGLRCPDCAAGKNREAVEKALSEIWDRPGDKWDDETGAYRLSVETKYDSLGELIEDVVDDLNRYYLPEGWRAEWVGTGNGDEEDLVVEPNTR